MNKKSNHLLEFAVKVFLIAVACNTAVAVTVIHYDTNSTYDMLPQNFIFIAGISMACFSPVCSIIFLIAKLNLKALPEKIFWVILSFGVIATGLLYGELRDIFVKYSDATAVFSMVAIFSILVAITSQYQLFIGADTTENDPVDIVVKIQKPLSTKDDFLNN